MVKFFITLHKGLIHRRFSLKPGTWRNCSHARPRRRDRSIATTDKRVPGQRSSGYTEDRAIAAPNRRRSKSILNATHIRTRVTSLPVETHMTLFLARVATHQAARWLLASYWLAAVLVSGQVARAASPVCVREGDELWEVSSRCLPDLEPCTMLNDVHFRVSRFDLGCWQPSDESQLQTSFAAAPFMRTVVYAHGNWMTADNTRGRGSYIYQRTAQRAAEPVRFIIYSWPSQRDGRPIRDVYEKADRSNTDTFYFAHFLSRVPADTPLGIYAFSFGGRVACGGLHMVNGGRLEGRTSPVWENPRQVRVSMLAPAFDRTWLAANRQYGYAMNSIQALVNIYNSQDPVLRRFRFITRVDRITSPIAAGFMGLADPRATQPLQSDQRIVQFDCGPDVGSSHDEMNYYHKCCAFNNALDNVLGK